MKTIRLVLFLIVLAVSFSASAEKAGDIIILNGYFFNELPAAVKKSHMKEDMKLFFVSTPDGTKAVCFYAPSLDLEEKTLKHAIPVDKVTEGEELLRRYNDQKEGKSISFTMGAEKPLINVGDKFPKFSATDINGKKWTSIDVLGKVMVLNLWFTGCGPCRAEMPELSTWKDEMPDVMFFSSTYETPEVARMVLDKVNFNWIPLVSDTQFRNWIGDNGYPLTIVVDKEGYIAAFEYGTSPEQRDSLKDKIAELR